MASKDTVFSRCAADIKDIEKNGVIKAEDIRQLVEMNIERLEYNPLRLASSVITAVCLNKQGFRGLGGRSGIYLNPDKIEDYEKFGTLLNNAIMDVKQRKMIVKNLKALGEKNFPGQMVFDLDGNLKTEKSLEEIIEELMAG